MKSKTGIFPLILLLIFLSGCNRKKAEAIKLAAEKFRSEAVQALTQLNILFAKNLSVVISEPEQQIETILNDIRSIENPMDINAELLDFWTEEIKTGVEAVNVTDQKFEELKSQYYRLEALFATVEQGTLLNAKSVKQAEEYTIKLTVQFINFANIVEENIFRNTARRVLIIEKMRAARMEQNQELREELLKNAAGGFVELRMEEDREKNEAVQQCLKAADSGRLLAGLIRNYDKLSVNDMLGTIRNALNYAVKITGENQNVGDLLEQFNTVEETIRTDPYWSVLLEKKITD